MAHIFSQIINQIAITHVDANMVIGAMVIIMMASVARSVWNTISGR